MTKKNKEDRPIEFIHHTQENWDVLSGMVNGISFSFKFTTDKSKHDEAIYHLKKYLVG